MARGPGWTKPLASKDQVLVRLARLRQESSPERKSSVMAMAARLAMRSARNCHSCETAWRARSRNTLGLPELKWRCTLGRMGTQARTARTGSSSAIAFKSEGAVCQAVTSQSKDRKAAPLGRAGVVVAERALGGS